MHLAGLQKSAPRSAADPGAPFFLFHELSKPVCRPVGRTDRAPLPLSRGGALLVRALLESVAFGTSLAGGCRAPKLTAAALSGRSVLCSPDSVGLARHARRGTGRLFFIECSEIKDRCSLAPSTPRGSPVSP